MTAVYYVNLRKALLAASEYYARLMAYYMNMTAIYFLKSDYALVDEMIQAACLFCSSQGPAN